MKANNRLMSDDNRYMSEIFRIVNGALRLDIERVRNYTAFLAEKLEKAGDTATAKRLRKLLQETDTSFVQGASARRVLSLLIRRVVFR